MKTIQCVHIRANGERCGNFRNVHPLTNADIFTCEKHGGVRKLVEPEMGPIAQAWVTKEEPKMIFREGPCTKCAGTGKFYHQGHVENGVFRGDIDKCFECNGKGYLDAHDVARNKHYWKPSEEKIQPEMDPILDVGGNPKVILQRWRNDGGHECGLEYPGLVDIIRIRYLGDRVPFDAVANFLTQREREWAKKNDRHTVWQLDLSYAFGVTRKGNVVRLVGNLPNPIFAVGRVEYNIKQRWMKALHDAGKNLSSFDLDNTISYLL